MALQKCYAKLLDNFCRWFIRRTHDTNIITGRKSKEPEPQKLYSAKGKKCLFSQGMIIVIYFYLDFLIFFLLLENAQTLNKTSTHSMSGQKSGPFAIIPSLLDQSSIAQF